jgi:colanic acid biosynthesis protein WcaH
MLSEPAFLEVIDRTPLVSIDLIVRDEQGRLLMGLRRNEPARGFWFVPGGRIFKGETLEAAFERITLVELGVQVPRSAARLFGAYTHLYEANALAVEGVSTHYVVLAHELPSLVLPSALPLAQHGRYRWVSAVQAHECPPGEAPVHSNNWPYFDKLGA